MCRAFLAVLVALAALATGCRGPGLTSEPASRSPEGASVLAYDWQGKPVLVRVDP